MILGFEHAALFTDKYEETVAFYQNVFHGEIMASFDDREGCWMRIGEDILEIFGGKRFPDEGAFGHIALKSTDVDSDYAYALEQGAKPMVAPKDIELLTDTSRRARIAFVKGVNDEQIELFWY